MEQKIFFIGLIEEDNNRNLLKMTKELFTISGYDIIYEGMENVIGFSNNHFTLIAFDLVVKDLCNMEFDNFKFDIVVHSFLDNCCPDIILNLFKKSRVCIYNSDGEEMIPLLSDLDKVIAINYGFNNKSTITISSYNVNNHIEVNLCLQRDIVTFYGDKVEPFEFVLEIKSTNEKHIYPVLAAATLNLLIGDSILSKKPYKNIRLDFTS
ncbi:hypothetical protein [Tissierella sp. Yu-01]|uniref:hypothetical protein n=1 Tax=Tissierella sp. Yu-01 TaxID=3035694 RepID=UPI00240E6B61|nr:hypothetical protein [Tissierella sp. Yu-01]WFA09898.1 hypothetical protein P3962_04945 [Tissierella sp. Yu-01]